MSVKKLIIAITGASGAIYGIELLRVLKALNLQTHLIISQSARLTICSETNLNMSDVTRLADYNYKPEDIAASISSGSFRYDGMIVAPCSMKTLSAIANGYESNLIIRAAGVCIKEQKKLLLTVRETPLSSIQLENMLKLSRLNVCIFPPVPAYYHNPQTIQDIINHTVARILDQFNIDTDLIDRWNGLKK